MRLNINNSFCEIFASSPHFLELIRKNLTYTNEEAILEIRNRRQQLKFAHYRHNKRLAAWCKKQIATLSTQTEVCLLQNNRFPTGLLEVVLELLNGKCELDIFDYRKVPEPRIKFPWYCDFELRPYQKEMVALAAEHKRGVFESSVGSGKSVIMQRIIYEAGVQALVVAPAIDLSIQLYDSFCEVFGTKNVELVKTGKKYGKKPIKITTVQTLTTLRKKDKLQDFLKNIELIVQDECHHTGALSYTELLPHTQHIALKYGFSGTFLRNDSKTMEMLGFLSNVLYRYPAKRAVQENYLTHIKVIIHSLKGKKAAKYQQEYQKNYCKNAELLIKIEHIFSEYIPKTAQTLILVRQKEASGAIIHEYLDALGIENTYICGDDKKERIKQALSEFNAGKIRVLIGSTIIGEGIDIKSTEHLIIATGGKSEIAITQATGRAVRLYPGKEKAVVHDFNFEGTKYLQEHLVKRIKVYEDNFGAEVELIE